MEQPNSNHFVWIENYICPYYKMIFSWIIKWFGSTFRLFPQHKAMQPTNPDLIIFQNAFVQIENCIWPYYKMHLSNL